MKRGHESIVNPTASVRDLVSNWRIHWLSGLEDGELAVVIMLDHTMKCENSSIQEEFGDFCFLFVRDKLIYY